MRILHLNQFGSRKGGAEGYIADVTAALQARGHDVHLVALTPDDAGEPLAATTYAPTPDWPSSLDATVSVLNRVLADFRPDVAYLHVVYHPLLVDWVARRLPGVAYIHAPYPVCPGSAQYLPKRAQICPHAAGAICLFNAQIEKCCWGRDPVKHLRLLLRVRRFGQAHRSLQNVLVGSEFMRGLLVRSGVPERMIARLAPVLLDPQPAADSVSPDAGVVLYAGRLTPEKGIRHLIQALAARDQDWRLLVAGDGPERAPSQALAAQLGVADRIEFLGWLDPQAMARCYQQSAVVACPSLWPEPFGRVGPEAFVHGRPVVAYATGGIPDWLTDGETGYLIAPGDVTQLSQRLQQLLANPGLCRQMGDQARRTALTQWRTEDHVRRLLEIFGAAVAQRDLEA